MVMIVDDEVCSANGTVVSSEESCVIVAPEPDPDGEHCQWFAFRCVDDEREGGLVRLDTQAMTWPEALDEYEVFASFDNKPWRRIGAVYSEDDERLDWWQPEGVREARYALWEPYTPSRRRRLLARMRRAHGASVIELGQSLDGEPIDAVRIGGGEAVCWVIARQHPGEVMAEWFAEGMIERLADSADPIARAVRRLATVIVVPCVNIDGATRGHHRVNAAGVDLNRSWIDADERAPEVLAVRAAIEQTGVGYFLDVHGDERTERAFAARDEGNPSYSEQIAALETRFVDRLDELWPAFDRESGYPLDAPGEGDLRCAANYVGERFGCPALTIELPFKRWTSRDARRFGHASVEALLAAIEP
jgi:murein tripeptide amidase MpaA